MMNMLGRKSAYAGPRVGRFELGRELGTGGYGRVLAAIDPKAGEVSPPGTASQHPQLPRRPAKRLLLRSRASHLPPPFRYASSE